MAPTDLIPNPGQRRLRIFTLDPGVAAEYDAGGFAEMTIAVPWEDLRPGPIGEYVEVVDADPASRRFYLPIDLNDPRLLAQDGLPPSETNPQFHQQMVYAVAMATIRHFEQALGRVALWAAHQEEDQDGKLVHLFVRRLRIYPHALRDRNAYYSPAKRALLFGSFPAGIADKYNAPDTLIHCALSHDIIAHETTHALLDGVHPHFGEPVNPDVLAFHEAFADIVALFQHFSYPGLLRYQIARTRGDLSDDNLLGQLAQQFGRAAGRGGALRDALGEIDKEGRWRPRTPDVHALIGVTEPHARGEVLVAAIFGAFIKVYRARTHDLYRIASDGSGLLRPGELHPDLSSRLADEAAATAQRVLQMCIRAIDYCPPVGITFGDYLRALVTADYDLDPDDTFGFRVAIIDSFRQWGIYPPGLRSLSTDALLWPTGDEAMAEANVTISADTLLQSLFVDEHVEDDDDRPSRRPSGGPLKLRPWTLESDRLAAWRGTEDNARALSAWLRKNGRPLLPALGVVVDNAQCQRTVFRPSKSGPNAAADATFEVHSVRTAVRRSRRGSLVTDLVVEILQRRRGYVDPAAQADRDSGHVEMEAKDFGDFRYRAGCTVLIDPANKRIRRVIRTAGTIIDDKALNRQRAFLRGEQLVPTNAFDKPGPQLDTKEPFALLHKYGDVVARKEASHDQGA